MSENDTSPSPSFSRRKIAIGAIAAAVAASAAVLFVLPAEFGIDPTGFGRAAGLTGLAPAGDSAEDNIYLQRGLARTNVLMPLPEGAAPDEATLRRTLADKGIAMPPEGAMRTDRYEVELLPYEGIEMKYDLAQGAPMIFAWKASAPVYLDLHSHPFDGGPEMTESFVIDQMPSQTAAYVAPFSGIHGWYWQNRTLNPVTVTLDAAGQFTGSRVFNSGVEQPRPLRDEQAALDGAAPVPE